MQERRSKKAMLAIAMLKDGAFQIILNVLKLHVERCITNIKEKYLFVIIHAVIRDGSGLYVNLQLHWIMQFTQPDLFLL